MRASDFTPDISWGHPKLTRHQTIHKRTARRILAAFGAGAILAGIVISVTGCTARGTGPEFPMYVQCAEADQ